MPILLLWLSLFPYFCLIVRMLSFHGKLFQIAYFYISHRPNYTLKDTSTGGQEYDLGFFDKDEDRVEPGTNPFAPDKVLTMCLV